MNEESNYPQDQIFECREQIRVKSCFFMKHLMKITSKKINQNIISFYFKLPDFSFKQQHEKNFLRFIKKINIKDLHQLIVKEPQNFNKILVTDSNIVF